MMTQNRKREDRSPLIVAVALALGITLQLFAGPIAGLIGAALGATATSVAVRAQRNDG